MAKAYPVSVVGESNYQRAITKKLVGTPVSLMHEPGNRFDERAIRVDNHRGQTIGYLARGSWVGRVIIDEGNEVTAKVAGVEREPNSGNYGVTLFVAVGPLDEPSKASDQSEVIADRVAKWAWGCLAVILIAFAIGLFTVMS